jgi:hypothetical protein
MIKKISFGDKIRIKVFDEYNTTITDEKVCSEKEFNNLFTMIKKKMR